MADLILAGNGPGELAGWIRPVAKEARALADETRQPLRLTLALFPSQFAGGRELEVVRGWNLFDRLLDPRTCLRAAAGLVTLPVEDQAVVIHLGGELWLSGRLAGQLRCPVCALAETTLIAGRHRSFSRIFAVSPEVASQLATRGVPSEKIITTGDPRADAIEAKLRTPSSCLPRREWNGDSPDGAEPRVTSYKSQVVSFLPGSRDRHFATLAPYFLNVAAALHALEKAVRFRLVVSPFLSPDLWARIREESARRRPELDAQWVTDEPWHALATSDLVVTIPGTNTLELAMLGVPFAVVVDTDLLPLAPLEGPLEWVTRMPGLGVPLRRAVLRRHLSHVKYTALPNLRAGRALVPEWVGRWTPEELAKQVAALLRDPAQQEAMRRELRSAFSLRPGASQAIVAAALGLAQQRIRP